MIWIASALAGGLGIYGEISPGAAWSDTPGPVVRLGAARAVRTNFGLFWGPYRSTLQYGRYQRLGLRWGAATAAPYVDTPLGVSLNFGPEYGRGMDMLKAGVFWKVSLNAAVFVADPSADDPQVTLGAIARLTGGGVYWFTRYLGFVGRIEGGPDIRGTRGVTFGGGLGIGLMARVGVLTRQKKLRQEWEGEDLLDSPEDQ